MGCFGSLGLSSSFHGLLRIVSVMSSRIFIYMFDINWFGLCSVRGTPDRSKRNREVLRCFLTCRFRASLDHKDDGQTKFIKPNSQR